MGFDSPSSDDNATSRNAIAAAHAAPPLSSSPQSSSPSVRSSLFLSSPRRAKRDKRPLCLPPRGETSISSPPQNRPATLTLSPDNLFTTTAFHTHVESTVGSNATKGSTIIPSNCSPDNTHQIATVVTPDEDPSTVAPSTTPPRPPPPHSGNNGNQKETKSEVQDSYINRSHHHHSSIFFIWYIDSSSYISWFSSNRFTCWTWQITHSDSHMHIVSLLTALTSIVPPRRWIRIIALCILRDRLY